MLEEPIPGFRYRTDPATGERYVEVAIRGELMNDYPLFNKGTAFPQDERDSLGLRGVLPPRVVTMERQAERVLLNYRVQENDLEKYLALMALLDRNETLFYRVLLDHLDEMLPIVYTPTVGQACQKFGRIYRRMRGIYLTPEDTGKVDEILAAWPFDHVSVIVVTDGERVLGLGDLGAGGMGISIGKISLYVAGAGIHPARALPVCLDVGTDNAEMLLDPLYLGKARRRVRGPEYDALVDAFMDAVARRFPGAMVQFEDFAMRNAFRLLDRWRDRACCFNDDIQGTGAVALAGVLAGLRRSGGKLADQRVVIAGAGSAGIGIARALAGAQLWICDVGGLLSGARTNLTPEQRPFARDEPGGTLTEIVQRVRPTVLIGVTGTPGLFTHEMVGAMDGPHPMVFPLSNPTSKVECTPDEARAWTGGRAIVATGSPFPDTPQCNNVYIFPGVGMGVLVSRATRVTDAMVRAAAETLARLSDRDIYPPLREIRRVSSAIALAVAKAAIADGVAPAEDDAALCERISAETWEPRYLPYRPAAQGVTRQQLFRGRR